MKNQKPIFWFYLLTIYILIQFFWWGILIVRLTEDKYQETQDVQNKIFMVIGEGAVFLLILVLGIWQVRKSLMKEIRVSRQQNNFLLSVSHELKTPISSIKLHLQTLNSRSLDKEKQSEIITYSMAEIERLNFLIDNILTASKMEYRNFEIFKEDFDFSEFATKKLSQLLTGIGREHTVEIHIQKGITIKSDREALTSIIDNLFENAVKYSPKGNKILFRASILEDVLTIEVEDEGSGITPEVSKEIFKKFYRSGNEEVRKTKGTGLGLYIVDQYVKLLRGDINIVSPATRNKGTVIKVNLPVS